LITKLQLAAMSRVDIPEEERRDFCLYVDEFQNFATESFADILSEARKYRLSLTLANQYIAQLEEMTPTGKSTKVRDSVFGNVGTLITFRVGAEDAEYLEEEFTPEIIAGDFVNLAKYNIYLKLMVEGVAGRPFSAETLSPFPKLEKSNREKIIKASQERYGTKKDIVEEKILRWIEPIKPPSAPQMPPRSLYDAQCSLCGKWIKVPFPPDKSRPIYCRSCLKKVEAEKTLPSISLEEIPKLTPVPFSGRKPSEEKPKREKKKVNLKELKEVLEKVLRKNKP